MISRWDISCREKSRGAVNRKIAQVRALSLNLLKREDEKWSGPQQ